MKNLPKNISPLAFDFSVLALADHLSFGLGTFGISAALFNKVKRYHQQPNATSSGPCIHSPALSTSQGTARHCLRSGLVQTALSQCKEQSHAQVSHVARLHFSLAGPRQMGQALEEAGQKAQNANKDAAGLIEVHLRIVTGGTIFWPEVGVSMNGTFSHYLFLLGQEVEDVDADRRGPETSLPLLWSPERAS